MIVVTIIAGFAAVIDARRPLDIDIHVGVHHRGILTVSVIH